MKTLWRRQTGVMGFIVELAVWSSMLGGLGTILGWVL